MPVYQYIQRMRPFSVSTHPPTRGSRMKTGLGVLLIALAQLMGGLCLLIIYELYKVGIFAVLYQCA